MHKERMVYLDRDGVVNRRAAPHHYIKTWDEFEFLPGVLDALRLLHQNGFKIVLITNQRGIARKMLTKDELTELHNEMCRKIQACGGQIDGIYVCPHEEGMCTCRKPKTGLFLQAEKRFCPDKSFSWMVGDSITDLEAGRNYGVHTIFIGDHTEKLADYVCRDLLEAANYMIKESQRGEK